MAGLLSGLLLGEVVLIVFVPQVKRLPRVWRYDRDLGWEHIPGARGRMVAPEFSAEMVINAAGQRDQDYPEERQSNSWRVIALGDSYVEGWGVELEASVTKLLEERLQQARADERVEVINMGVAGYGTDQELLYYERDGQHYQPDDVLVFFYGNDIWNNFTRAFKPYYILGPADRLQLAGVPVRFNPTWDMEYHDTRPWPQRARRYLRRHWHLYALIRKVFVPARRCVALRPLCATMPLQPFGCRTVRCRASAPPLTTSSFGFSFLAAPNSGCNQGLLVRLRVLCAASCARCTVGAVHCWKLVIRQGAA